MRDEEINAVVSKLLRERFEDLGFERSTVESEEDFDGASVLRVIAHFRNRDVPSDRLINAMHDIRSALIGRGEDRFVYLSSVSPQDELLDEDLE